jgi:hypothetical protein
MRVRKLNICVYSMPKARQASSIVLSPVIVSNNTAARF